MEKDTILYVLTKSQEYLAKKNVANPRLDAEVLLADVLNFSRVQLYTKFDMILNENEKDEYRKRIKLRGELKPVAYITGKKSFYKHDFIVDSSVLIPRPETEELVEWVSKDLMKEETQVSVLDLCCGSGCIGLSLLKDVPNIKLSMSDISMNTLSTAQKNATLLCPEAFSGIQFLVSDLFLSFPTEQKFNYIVSNPPYIPETEKNSVMKDVLEYEPHIALFVPDMESFYLRLLGEAKQHLLEGGKLYLETHHLWAEKIKELGLKNGFSTGFVKKDYSRKERFIFFQG
jgi:release factor glutamine methyltransferase